MNLTREDFQEMAANKANLTNAQAKALVETFFSSIKDALKKGDEVKISNFGSWVTKTRKPKNGRNPQTNEKLIIKARKVVTFKPAAALKKGLARTGATTQETEREVVGMDPPLILEHQYEADV